MGGAPLVLRPIALLLVQGERLWLAVYALATTRERNGTARIAALLLLVLNGRLVSGCRDDRSETLAVVRYCSVIPVASMIRAALSLSASFEGRFQLAVRGGGHLATAADYRPGESP